MLKSFAIDWIRVTTKNHTLVEMVDKFSWGLDFEQWSATKPKQGYTHCIIHPWGHMIFWHIERKEMGINIMFSGRAMNELYSNNVDVKELLRYFKQEKFTYTRLDLAIDVRDVKIDIVSLMDCEHTGSANNDPELYMKGPKARGGATIYVGARQSEKFLRIYDKAKEQKLNDVLWTRFEIEMKGRTATKIAYQLCEMTYEECGKVTQQMIKGIYNPENSTFQEAMEGSPVRVSSTKNESHNTYEWLMNTVAKTLARTIVSLPHRDVMLTFEREVQKHIRELAAHGLTQSENND